MLLIVPLFHKIGIILISTLIILKIKKYTNCEKEFINYCFNNAIGEMIIHL